MHLEKKILVIIPARGGSKEIPGKNIKELGGKPLIEYSIDLARQLFSDEDICVSTDSDEIIRVVENTGLKVPFVRPSHLATDTASSYDVLIHAVEFYESQSHNYDAILLLQPTSPFRLRRHIEEAMRLYSNNIDMVVSVKESQVNPYYNLFEENKDGYLTAFRNDGYFTRRQDAPKTWEYNGSIYIINIDSLKKSTFSLFKKIVKYPMEDIFSIDVDTSLDWALAEVLYQNIHGRE